MLLQQRKSVHLDLHKFHTFMFDVLLESLRIFVQMTTIFPKKLEPSFSENNYFNFWETC